jgi:hypothetical protein
MQVGVLIQSEPRNEAHTNFGVHCVARYTWLGEQSLDQEILKRIYSWAVAVQTGAIRQHVIQETLRGPFRTPYFIPVSLVEIQEASDTDTSGEEKKVKTSRKSSATSQTDMPSRK